MPTYDRAYFDNLFQAGYTLRAQDLKDLINVIILIPEDLGIDADGATITEPIAIAGTIKLANKNLIRLPRLDNQKPTRIEINNNQLQIVEGSDNWITVSEIIANDNNMAQFLPSVLWSVITVLNLANNAINSGRIEELLVTMDQTLAAVAIDLTGGTNASHATWSPEALAAEANILLHGGSVTSNP